MSIHTLYIYIIICLFNYSITHEPHLLSRFGHQAPVTGIDALSRERAITAGGFDCTIRIWKIAEESQLIYNGHRGSIECVRLINEENFLSSGDDGSLCVWSVMKKKPLCTREKAHGVNATNGQANWISAIATLTNTDIIASGKNEFTLTTFVNTLNIPCSRLGFVRHHQFTRIACSFIQHHPQRFRRQRRIDQAVETRRPLSDH